MRHRQSAWLVTFGPDDTIGVDVLTPTGFLTPEQARRLGEQLVMAAGRCEVAARVEAPAPAPRSLAGTSTGVNLVELTAKGPLVIERTGPIARVCFEMDFRPDLELFAALTGTASAQERDSVPRSPTGTSAGESVEPRQGSADTEASAR